MKNKSLIVIILVSVASFYLLFGIVGVRTIVGLAMFFIVPFYLMLDYYELDLSEKLIFSAVLGIGLCSVFVYYLGLLFKSLNLGIVASFILLYGIGAFFQYKKRSKSKA